MDLCSLCLNFTVFTFREQLYAQTEGLPMGSPLSPIEVNIFIENFEHIVFTNLMRPPKIWKRYVDDSSQYCQSAQHKVSLCTSITSLLTKQFNSQWAAKVKMPFLDCRIKRNQGETLNTTVYMKLKNTSEYLNFHSCYKAKQSNKARVY